MDSSISPARRKNSCFSVNFCLPYFVVRGIHSKNQYVFLAIWLLLSCNTPLYLKTFLALKSALSEINIATPTFLWLVLAWHIVLHSFIFNLYVSLYLKLVSFKQHEVGSHFLIQFGNLFLLTDVFRSLTKMFIDIIG